MDLTKFEQHEQYLEGTGSVVFDYKNKLAFACISARTSETVFNDLCKRLGYQGFIFDATNSNNSQIYHTNVLMTICSKYSLNCLDAIDSNIERNMVKSALSVNGSKKIIELTFAQLNQFAGNSFEVFDKNGNSKLIMSRTAHASLSNSRIVYQV